LERLGEESRSYQVSTIAAVFLSHGLAAGQRPLDGLANPEVLEEQRVRNTNSVVGTAFGGRSRMRSG
jgi:hypothetical protein